MSLMAKKAPDASSLSPEVYVAVATPALLEVTSRETFLDEPVVTQSEETITVIYPSSKPGYPGWNWTVSLSHLQGANPQVLEVDLLPGQGALVSPEWLPWTDRLEEYLLHEKELAASDGADSDDEDTDFDDDVDGVDIDQLDLELDPAPLEVPDEPDDLFDHVELDEPDPLDP
jgi:hypothetical protein